MADNLLKLKTGTIAKIAQTNANGSSVVPLDEGSIYFAVDTTTGIGKILYDAPNGAQPKRIVMSTQAEYADNAGYAQSAGGAAQAEQLMQARGIDGVMFNGTSNIIHFGVCDTVASTGAKTVACEGFSLARGSWIAIKFTYTNTVAPGSLTLNVNNTGAKRIYYRGTDLPRADVLRQNSVYIFVYDGSNYHFIGDIDTDTNTTYNAATQSSDGLMSSSDKTKLDNISDGATKTTFQQKKNSGVLLGILTIDNVGYNLYCTDDTWIPFQGATANSAGSVGYINNAPASGNTNSYFASDGTWKGVATTGEAGLMSGGDKAKLDSIELGATKTIVAGSDPITVTPIAGKGNVTISHNTTSVSTLQKGDTNNQTPGFGSTFKVLSAKANTTGHLTSLEEHTVKIPNATATGSAAGLMSSDDYTMLHAMQEQSTRNIMSADSPIKVSASTGNVKITHEASGVTAATKGDTTNQTPAFGGTFKVPSGSVNSTGHLTAFADHTVKIPDTTASGTAAGLMSSNDYTMLHAMQEQSTRNIITGSDPIAVSASTGNVAISHKTSGVTAGSKGDTANQIIEWGGSFKALSGTVNATGHLSAFNEHTVTIPGNTATQQNKGLMSPEDKSKMDYLTGIYAVKGTQTSNTGSWTGNLPAVSALYDGLTIAYFLPRDGSGNATLTLYLANNVSTGAINVYYGNNSRLTTHYGAGSTIFLTYWSAGSISVNGTVTTDNRWTRCEYDSTNIYQLRHGNGTYLAKTNLYRYQLLLTAPTLGTTLIPINAVDNNTGTSKTLTTEKFDPFGQILYYATTGTINSGAAIPAWALYQQVGLDLRYSFNTGQTLTTNKDVYLVADPQTDGSAKLSSTPITQTLPTSSDGKLYIYLGHAYNNYCIELYPYHPIYQYKNSAIQLYTGEHEASQSNSGLMSASDKTKLDNIDAQATRNVITADEPIVVSASTGNVKITHKTSITAASKGDTNNQTPGFGSTFKAVSGTVNATGHLTAFADHTVKIPDTLASGSAKGLMSSDQYTKLEGIDDQATRTVMAATSPIKVSASTGNVTITHENSGVTANTYGVTAATKLTPAFGDNVLIPGFTVDAKGHITAAGHHNVTIPATIVTGSVPGLMSADMYSAWQQGIRIAGNTVLIGGTELTATTLRSSLGLSNAMHFIGKATVTITDGSTTDPVITNYSFGTNGANAQSGDVIIDKDSGFEYVWSVDKKWERLGPDGSYSLTGHTHDAADIVSGTLGVARGGTGQNSLTQYGILVGNGTSGITTVSPNTTSTKKFLRMTGTGSAGAAPAWDTLAAADIPTLSITDKTTGTLPVTRGGTGMTTATNVNAVVIGNSSTANAAMQTVRTGNGAFYATAQDGKPQFGTLPVAQGGTGQTSFTAGYVLVGNGSNAINVREIKNNTSVGALGWTSNDASIRLINENTLAYWNGAYSGTSSNLKILGTVTTGTWQATTIAVAYGGTGITSNPSMLVNLASTTADTVFKASPRPGVTGTLPVGNGGTGQTSFTANAIIVGNGSSALKVSASKGSSTKPIYIDSSGVPQTISSYEGASRYLQSPDTRNTTINPQDLNAATGVQFDFKAKATVGLPDGSYAGVMTYRPYASTSDWSGGPAHQIAYNSTGAILHRISTGNTTWGDWETILTTNSSIPVGKITGTLPVGNGGTGQTTFTVNSVILGNTTSAFKNVATANGAFYATEANGLPKFGTLPVAQGGTGVTSIANIQAGKDGSGNTITSTYVKKAGDTMTGTLYINVTADTGGTADTGALIIGNKAGENIAIDGNEVMARNNKAVSTLYLNNDGGQVYMGGNLKVATGIGTANTSSTSGIGISLYNGPTTGKPDYGFMFAGTPTFGRFGDVQSDWATYFTMSGNEQRGWIFRKDSTNVASISARGYADVKKVTVDTAVTLEYNSSTQSLDFIFA